MAQNPNATASSSTETNAGTTSSSHKLVQRILGLASEKKAYTPRVYEVGSLFNYTDYVVVLTGRSDRQVRAIAENISTTLKLEDGLRPVGVEGEDLGQWVLMDYSDVVIHIFNAPVREYYDIDGLFGEAPKLAVPPPEWEHEIKEAQYEQRAYAPI